MKKNVSRSGYIPPRAEWSEPEQWAWRQIYEGKIADFNALHGELDPHQSNGWSQNRLISPAFFESILLHEPFRSALPRQGVRIVGAWVTQPINLENAHLVYQWTLDKSRIGADVRLSRLKSTEAMSFNQSVFTGSLDLSSAKLDGQLLLGGAKCTGMLNMYALEVGQSLIMCYGAEFAEVILRAAQVSGQLDMTGAKCTGTLTMDALKVGQSLFMRYGAEFAEVILRGAKVGGQLDMTGAKCTGTLAMDTLEVDQHLFMRYGAEFAEVILRGAKVGGQLDMTDAKCTGTLAMDALEVGQHLFMHEGAEFAEVILSGAKVGGLDMTRVKCTGTLTMDQLEVGQSLFMRDGAEFTEVKLGGAKVGGQLDMTRAKFTGMLDMNALTVGQSLLMRDGAEFAEVILRAAKVGGQLDMTGAKYTGTLTMDGLSVEYLFMRNGAEFAEVILRGAKVGGQLDMTGAKCTGTLSMDGLNIGQHLLMSGAEFVKVILNSAKVGVSLSLIGAKCTGTLDMDALEVGQNLLMCNAEFEKEVNLVFANIDGNLDLSGAKLNAVDLTGAHIKGELQLGTGRTSCPTWREGSRLILRNTEVGAIQDEFKEGAWPNELDMSGLTYSRLGGLHSENAASDIASRNAEWFIDKWLKKTPTYSPQPYQQLAKILRTMGYSGKANDVLYAGQERERKERAKGFPYLGLSFLKWTIGYGYGYRYFYSLIYVLFFTIAGAMVLSCNNAGEAYSIVRRFFVSLNELLPIIELEKKGFGDIRLEDWQQIYFYIHKLVGYILGGFVVAGLSGITKRSDS